MSGLAAARGSFFDIDLDEPHHGFALANAFDVDFNKRGEIDASNMPAKEVNLRLRELMEDGYGTIVVHNPGASIRSPSASSTVST